jgi:hypothetical protein
VSDKGHHRRPAPASTAAGLPIALPGSSPHSFTFSEAAPGAPHPAGVNHRGRPALRIGPGIPHQSDLAFVAAQHCRAKRHYAGPQTLERGMPCRACHRAWPSGPASRPARWPTQLEVTVMSIGGSIALIIIGAILRFAVTWKLIRQP